MGCKSCSSPREASPIAPTTQFAGPVAPPTQPTSTTPALPARTYLPLLKEAPQPMLPDAPFCQVADPVAVPGCELPTAPSSTCHNPNVKKSVAATPGILPNYLQTSTGATSMMLLGRVGSALAHLLGTGYLRVKDGIVSVVESLEISTRMLWPDAVNTGSTPVNPQPYPYQLVADEKGCSYLLRGKAGESVVSVWNPTTSMWELTALPDLKKCNVGRIDKATALQITGFEPYGLTDETVEKCQKVLCGEGFVYLSKLPTNPSDPGCVCEECNNADRDVECVASTIPLPPKDGGVYGIQWDSVTSSYTWVSVT